MVTCLVFAIAAAIAMMAGIVDVEPEEKKHSV